jgi:hypothetical protein
MSYIINVCTALADGIRERGQVHGNTKEMIAVNLNIDLSNTNYAEEQGSVADYYGGRFSRRYESEKFHYAQLKFAMLHKVEETAYFFKLSREEATESRKLIIFSNDCISSVQYYNRGGDTGGRRQPCRSSRR